VILEAAPWASLASAGRCPTDKKAAVFLRRPDLGSVERDLVVGAARGAGANTRLPRCMRVISFRRSRRPASGLVCAV
jgi:hypothetical protein